MTVDGVTDGLNTQYSAVEIEMGDAADVFTRASRGDEGANMIMNETAEGLSILCINICRILDPEFIIIGGGMSLAGDALLQPIQKYFKERSWTVLSDDVRIVIASNSEDAGIVGAALHAFACFARTRENLAFETMILDYSPSSSSVMRISKSVEVLNYMHSNRDSASNKNILDAYHNLGDDTIMTAPSVAINEIKHDINQYQITGKTTAKSSDNEIHKENNKLNNSISSISSSKNLSMIFFVSGALSLFSACALGVSTVLRNSNERECVKNDFEIPNLIHYSAFVCQICAGSYFLYNSQKEVF